jgi:drug/metabolite transporter (DMT)-like permease
LVLVVDREQAGAGLEQVLRAQGQVADAAEREVRDGSRGERWSTAAALWVFVAIIGADLASWVELVLIVVFGAVMIPWGVRNSRKRKVMPHRSQYQGGRMMALWLLGAGLVGGTMLLSGWLLGRTELPVPSLIQATLTTLVFVFLSAPLIERAVTSVRPAGSER